MDFQLTECGVFPLHTWMGAAEGSIMKEILYTMHRLKIQKSKLAEIQKSTVNPVI